MTTTEPLLLEPIKLRQFSLYELSQPLHSHWQKWQDEFAEATRQDGAFTVALPPAWERVIEEMIPRGHEVARRHLTEDGQLNEDLRRLNEGSQSAIAPVWLSDRTQPDKPEEYQPQRSIFIRLEKMWEVYGDAAVVLGFLLKLFVRQQALCRHLELLQLPPQLWKEATGSAIDASWLTTCRSRQQHFDRLANEAPEFADERDGEQHRAWSERVRRCCESYVAECECWHWASMNFYLYNDDTALEKVPIRAIVDDQGRHGFAATLLREHADYDFVASVVNNQVGLQARDRDGQWRSVEAGSLLINTGKAMQLLAGDRYCDGEIVGGNMRAIPHRVVVQGYSEQAVRDQLESLQKRISIVGVTEPHGDNATLITWDAANERLFPVAGLQHCKFWQFLTRRVPPADRQPSPSAAAR